MTSPTTPIDTTLEGPPATCARCGDCCERFALATDHEALGTQGADPPAGYSERDPAWEEVWLVWDKHLADTAFQRAHFQPFMVDGKQERDEQSGRSFYTCDALD